MSYEQNPIKRTLLYTDYRFFTDCTDYKLFNFLLCRQYLYTSTTQIPTQQKDLHRPSDL